MSDKTLMVLGALAAGAWFLSRSSAPAAAAGGAASAGAPVSTGGGAARVVRRDDPARAAPSGGAWTAGDANILPVLDAPAGGRQGGRTRPAASVSGAVADLVGSTVATAATAGLIRGTATADSAGMLLAPGALSAQAWAGAGYSFQDRREFSAFRSLVKEGLRESGYVDKRRAQGEFD